VGTRVGCTEFRRNPLRLASSPATPMMPSETHEESPEEARDEGDNGENTGYPVLTAEDGHALNVGSLCVVCEKQGVTRILPSTIPWCDPTPELYKLEPKPPSKQGLNLAFGATSFLCGV